MLARLWSSVNTVGGSLRLKYCEMCGLVLIWMCVKGKWNVLSRTWGIIEGKGSGLLSVCLMQPETLLLLLFFKSCLTLKEKVVETVTRWRNGCSLDRASQAAVVNVEQMDAVLFVCWFIYAFHYVLIWLFHERIRVLNYWGVSRCCALNYAQANLPWLLCSKVRMSFDSGKK